MVSIKDYSLFSGEIHVEILDGSPMMANLAFSKLVNLIFRLSEEAFGRPVDNDH